MCFDPPGHVLVHRIMSIILKIQHIARMVYVFLDTFCVQLVASERFNRGMGLFLDLYINNQNNVMQVIDIYFCVD